MRQIIRSADPVNYRKSIQEISNLLGDDAICDLSLDQLFETLHKKLESNSDQTQGLITYLTATVEAYLQRRRNIFAILGKNEEDTELVEDFNANYFN
mgnify:CR=1 FL=1|jgi:hypothetical protein